MNPVIEFLMTRKGKSNAVTSKELEAAYGISGSEIRNVVNEYRCRGFPICSGNKGYYCAATMNELAQTIDHLNGRIKRIQEAKNGLATLIKT